MNKFSFLAECEILAAEQAASEPRKFAVHAYNGGPLKVANHPFPIIVDLSGLTTSPDIVANLDHRPDNRVGHINTVDNNARRLLMFGVVSAESDSAREFVGSASNNFPWKASIEAAPEGTPEFIPAGQTVNVNGQTFNGPVLVSRKTELFGVAFLTRGADPNTTVTLAAGEAVNIQQGEGMEFESWLKGLGFDPAAMSDEQKAAMQKVYDSVDVDVEAEQKAEEQVAASASFNAFDIVAASNDHSNNLEVIYAEYDGNVAADELQKIRATAANAAKAIKAKALASKWSPSQCQSELRCAANDVRVALIRAERPKGPAIHASHADVNADVIEASLAQSAGLPNIEKHYTPQVLQAAHTAYRGRIGLGQILIMAAAANGFVCRLGDRVHAGNLREVLRYAFGGGMIHAAASTLSLPGIFSNLGNKELLEGYSEEDQTWKEVAAIKSVNDFKQATSYRMLDNMEYEELLPGGHIKHGTVGEESYTRQVKTYAKMFALIREDLINDDLGAFDDLRERVGKGAAKKLSNLFWTRFMNNASFFTDARGNYLEGSTTNLGTDGVGLGLALTKFRKMRSPAADGQKRSPVGGRPEILLVPPELAVNAEKLHVSTNLSSVKADEANIHAGKYRPVVSDWLSDADFPGYSSTAYYLLRSPKAGAAAVVSFLNGQQTPTVETADADFDQLGVQFRGFHDFGVDLAEYLCGVKVKGAA